MAELKYLEGDATYPVGDGLKVIPHVCNNIDKWGAGFVLALNKRWTEPEFKYHQRNYQNLGDIEIVPVENDIVVINMIGQHGVITDNPLVPPIRYSAIITALEKVQKYCQMKKDMGVEVSVHMPKIGSDRAGGDWELIEHIIINTLVAEGTDVYVYVYTG